jgi:hypothetical protein
MPSTSSDIDDLQKSLNDISAKTTIVWTTFVTFEMYLAISFGSVTHRRLFLETPLQLPILNVELPLTGFFVVAPTLLLVFLVYMVLQLLILIDKSAAFERGSGMFANQIHRQTLDSFFLVQILVGPRGQQRGVVGFLLVAVAGLTLIAAPLLVLLQAEVTFLPYQSGAITWWHRFCLLAGLAIVFVLCFRAIREASERSLLGRIAPSVWRALMSAIILGVVF